MIRARSRGLVSAGLVAMQVVLPVTGLAAPAPPPAAGPTGPAPAAAAPAPQTGPQAGAPTADPPGAALLELVVLDDVPKALADRTTEELRAKATGVFRLVPDDVLARVAEGREAPPDLAEVEKLLAEGKQRYTQLEFKKSILALKAAKAKLAGLLPRLRDYRLLLDTQLYLGAALLASADRKSIGEAEFAVVLRLRPEHQLDQAQFSPAVVDAFEAVRKAQAKVARGRVIVTAEPPGASIYVDEVPIEGSPVNLPLPVGEHQLRVELAGHTTHTEKLAIASYAKIETTVALEPHPASVALARLRELAASGGAPADTTGVATTVAAAVGAPGVILAAVGATDEAYLLSVVHLSREGSGRAVAVPLPPSPDRAAAACEQALRQLAVAVAESSTAGGAVVGAVEGGMIVATPPGRSLDYGKWAIGMAPGMAPARKAKIVAAPPPPIYARWWLWAGALALAGAGGGAWYYVASRPDPAPTAHFVVERQR